MIVDNSGRVWAMRPAADLIAEHAHSRSVPREQPQPIVPSAATLDGSKFAQVVDGVAIVPVRGALMARHSVLFYSYEEIERDLTLAWASEQVHSILLDIDSPGGLAAGCADLAAHIRAIRGQKPVVGHVRTMCASAAYMLGGSCDQLWLGSDAVTGSVGSVIEYVDLEPVFEAMGARVVRVVAEQSPNKRLDPTDEAGQAEMQALVDAGCANFIAAVAAGRGVTEAEVANRFGQGLVFEPGETIARGMADGRATFNEILAELAGRVNLSSAVPVAAEEEDSMDWNSITAAELREHRPELVSDIETAAAEAALDGVPSVEEVGSAAAAAERARILALDEVAVAGHEALVAAAKADGKTTPEQLALQILQAERTARSNHLQGRADSEAGDLGQVGADLPVARSADVPLTADAARERWAASAELQAEFPTAETYAAFVAAENRGQVRVLRRAS